MKVKHFDIFISYSRKNIEFARQLQKALERYKPPKKLKISKRRRLSVFRDEQDLTGVEYFSSIERFLHASSKLIVICSPSARKSDYINEEIRYFVKNKGSENIIPILLSGIPNNEATSEQAEEMAFPEALCEALEMPLAASYVGFGEGKDNVKKARFENSWFTILANIYDLNRDEIEQRERQRKHLQIIGWGSALGITALAFAVIALIAISQRNEATAAKKLAQRQERIAEDEATKAKRQLSRFVASEAKRIAVTSPVLAGLLAIETGKIAYTDAADSAYRAVLDSLTGTPLPGLGGPVYSVDTSAGGKIIAAGRQDGTISVWDLSQSPMQSKTLQGHIATVSSVTLSADGKVLVSGSSDRTIRLWDLTEDPPKSNILPGNHDGVISIALSKDAKILAAASDDNKIRIWSLSQPEAEPKTISVSRRKGWANLNLSSLPNVTCVSLNADGSVLAYGTYDHWIKVLKLNQPEIKAKILDGHTEKIDSVALNADGTKLVSGSADKTVRIWDLATDEPKSHVLYEHNDIVWSVDISADGNQVISGGVDNSVQLGEAGWSPLSGKQTMSFRGHEEQVSSVALSSDGKTQVSGSLDNMVRIWNFGKKIEEPKKLLGLRSATTLALSTTGQLLVAGDYKGNIWMVDLSHKDTQPKLFAKFDQWIHQVTLSEDGFTLASGGEDKTVHVWDLNNPEEPIYIFRDYEDAVSNVALSGNGKLLASKSGGKIFLRNLSQPKTPPKIFQGNEKNIWGVTLSSDGRYLASYGANEYTISLWDLAQPGAQPRVLRGHNNVIYGAVFSSDGKTLVSGSMDSTVRVWDIGQAQPASHILRVHLKGITSIALSANGKVLAYGSKDKTIRVWDFTKLGLNPKVLEMGSDYIFNEPTSVLLSGDGKLLISNNGDVRIWHLDPEYFSQLICPRLGRNMSKEEWGKYFGDLPYHATCKQWKSPG
jgi:WD40 repeat protein